MRDVSLNPIRPLVSEINGLTWLDDPAIAKSDASTPVTASENTTVSVSAVPRLGPATDGEIDETEGGS